MSGMKLFGIAITLLIVVALAVMACGSHDQAPSPQAQALVKRMQALIGENKVIEGDYDGQLAVDAANGVFVGQMEDSLMVFRGIPYAVQPVGPLRWCEPRPEPDSHLVREAYYFGHSAIQRKSPYNSASHYRMGEDCLTLNVWTAAAGMRSARRPVMVWFHGGSYNSGGTVAPGSWGASLVKEHPEVIFVSVNYRLGILGFLDLSSLPDGQRYARSGNLGILDQVEALRWIKRNIAAFGGDPGNVTVFGQSAGGGSVSILMSIDEAQGLFRRVIAMSGSLALTSSRDDCQRLTKRVLDETGAKTVADLVALSDSGLIALNDKVGEFARFPMRDSLLIPASPYARFDGFTATTDLLIGTTADEVRLWIDDMGGKTGFRAGVELWYRYIGMSLDDAQRAAAAQFLDAVQGKRVWRIAEFFNDLIFRGPAIEQAQRHAASGGKTYMYYWTKAGSDTLKGACHACEMPYVLNNTSDSALNAALGREVRQMWVNFAATGNPSTPSHHWPAYDAASRRTMVLGDTIQVVDDPLPRQRRLIAPLLRNYISPVFSDLKAMMPWIGGIAAGTLIAALLLIVWASVKLRRLLHRRRSR